jgi:hypothetical protein
MSLIEEFNNEVCEVVTLKIDNEVSLFERASEQREAKVRALQK